jgi:ribosomal protein L19E
MSRSRRRQTKVKKRNKDRQIGKRKGRTGSNPPIKDAWTDPVKIALP